MADNNKKSALNFDIKTFYFWDIKLLILLATILCGVLSYVLYINVLDEEQVNLINLKSEESKLKQTIGEQFSALKILPEFSQKQAQLDHVEKLVDSQFPDGDEMPEMVVEINQLAELSNVSINNLLPSSDDKLYVESGLDMPKDSAIWTREFSLSGSASGGNFPVFLYKLAEFPRVIQVNSVSVDRVDDNRVNFTMSISVFFVKQKNVTK